MKSCKPDVPDVPANESAPATKTFDVDAEDPRIAITAPPYATPQGTLEALAGTAADDLGLAAVEVAIQDEGTGRWWSGSSFTSAAEAWSGASAVSGIASPWSYDGFHPPIPLNGAVWHVHARVRDVYGRLGTAQASVYVAPADRLRQVKDYEDPGMNLGGPRQDQQKSYSCRGADASSGKAVVRSAQGGAIPGSPAMNIAAAFAGAAVAGAADSPWGWGWVSEHGQTLFLRPSGAVRLSDGDGLQRNFFPPAPGAADPELFRSPLQDFRTLRVSARSLDGSPTRFRLRDLDGATFDFVRATGTALFPLSAFADRNGNYLNYEPDAQGRLGVVRDRHGRTLALAYNAAFNTTADSPSARAVFINS